MTQRERYILYLLVALLIFLPLIFTFNVFENRPTPEVRGVYDTINSLNPGDVMVLSMDFDPGSEPELYPMALAVLRHAFSKDIRVIGVGFFSPQGVGLGVSAFSTVGDEFGKVNGVDYVFLGYKPVLIAAIQAMNDNIKGLFQVDAWGRRVEELKLLQDVPKLRNNVKYLVVLAAGETVRPWVAFGSAKGGYPMGAGCTAVSFADYFSFYQSGQLNGLMGGLKAAAEYEVMVADDYLKNLSGILEKSNSPFTVEEIKELMVKEGAPKYILQALSKLPSDRKFNTAQEFSAAFFNANLGAASAGMNSQSFVHAILTVFIIMGNIAYFRSRKKKRAGGTSA